MPPPAPDAVVARELSLLWQDVFTYASWGLVVIMLIIAWRLGKRERSPFYVLVILAAGVAAFAEPLYDIAFDLWFYDATATGEPGAMFSHFTAFGIVQPNWTHSGYIILYANMALYAGRKIAEGTLTRKVLFILAGIELLTSCIFEIIGVNTDVYTYWGPHQLRIFDYPLVIGVLEAAQVVVFTVVACLLRKRVRSAWGLLGLFALFPVTFFGVNFGAGAPTIIALHLEGTSGVIVAGASLLSIGLAVALVHGASLFLPNAPAGASVGPTEAARHPSTV